MEVQFWSSFGGFVYVLFYKTGLGKQKFTELVFF